MTEKLSQAPGDLSAVERGKTDVEHDRIGQAALDFVECVDSIVEDANLMAVQLEQDCDGVRHIAVVFDNEYARHGKACRFRSPERSSVS